MVYSCVTSQPSLISLKKLIFLTSLLCLGFFRLMTEWDCRFQNDVFFLFTKTMGNVCNNLTNSNCLSRMQNGLLLGLNYKHMDCTWLSGWCRCVESQEYTFVCSYRTCRVFRDNCTLTTFSITCNRVIRVSTRCPMGNFQTDFRSSHQNTLKPDL